MALSQATAYIKYHSDILMSTTFLKFFSDIKKRIDNLLKHSIIYAMKSKQIIKSILQIANIFLLFQLLFLHYTLVFYTQLYRQYKNHRSRMRFVFFPYFE